MKFSHSRKWASFARGAAARSLGLGLVLGCGVPEPPGRTGGVDGEELFREGGAPGETCGRGFVVVEQGADYRSTNVALVGLDGTTLSESFASSATDDVGLVPPLIGDITPPTMRMDGDRLVLLDRHPASIILWFDVATGQQTARLDVSTGFLSNPHDYLEISSTKAYVPRLESNPSPGRQPYDAGGDVLIVDPSVPAITGSIPVGAVLEGERPEIHPRPRHIVRAGDRAYVLLSSSDSNFAEGAAPARLVAIDVETDAITDVLVLDGLERCTGLSLSPDGTRLVVGCPTFGQDLSRSGIALVDLEPVLAERTRFGAEALGGRPLGFFVELAGPDTVLTPSFARDGDPPEAGGDRLLEVDMATGTTRALATRQDFWVIGGVRCAVGCGVCVAADSGVPGGVLHVLDVEDGRVVAQREHVVERRYAMPPRYVGRF
jgi:hypothetical protein